MPYADAPKMQGTITIPIEESNAMKALIAALTAKLKELEARRNKNSKNFNKPPSSDWPKKGKVKNSWVPGGRPSGGQHGHEGKILELKPAPGTIVELKPKHAKRYCGSLRNVIAYGQNIAYSRKD